MQVNTSGFGDGNNQDIWAGMAVFGDYLYVGTENGTTGVRIWRSANGADWSQVNPDGFGDPNNSGISTMTVFDSYLYAGTSNNDTGGEMWRSNNGTGWDQVDTYGFGDYRQPRHPGDRSIQ